MKVIRIIALASIMGLTIAMGALWVQSYFARWSIERAVVEVEDGRDGWMRTKDVGELATLMDVRPRPRLRIRSVQVESSHGLLLIGYWRLLYPSWTGWDVATTALMAAESHRATRPWRATVDIDDHNGWTGFRYDGGNDLLPLSYGGNRQRRYAAVVVPYWPVCVGLVLLWW